MATAFVATGALLLAAYKLGLMDWPKFEYRKELFILDRKQGSGSDDKNKENDEDTSEMIALVAVSTEKEISKHFGDMLKGVANGMEAVAATSKPALDWTTLCKSAVQAYFNVPAETCPRLGVGLFFDDPTKVDRPRWAAGFIIPSRGPFGSDITNVKDLAVAMQKQSGLSVQDHPIRAVRITTPLRTTYLQARIPWRHRFTPALAPMLHWGRAFAAYRKGGYTTTPSPQGTDGAVAMEVYFMGQNCCSAMDYVVVMGDTSAIWQDTFPKD